MVSILYILVNSAFEGSEVALRGGSALAELFYYLAFDSSVHDG